MRNWQQWIRASVLSLGLVGGADVMSANQYLFTNIADNTGPIRSFFVDSVHINNAGTVAFSSSLRDFSGSSVGIYTGQGGPLTTIADGTQFRTLSSSIGLNNHGVVVFSGFIDLAQSGLFLSDAGNRTIAYPFGPSIGFPGLPAINDGGAVVFQGDILDAGGDRMRAIFRGDSVGSPPTVIATARGIAPNSDLALSWPDINAAGTVAFAAYPRFELPTMWRSWYAGSGASLTLIADDSGPVFGTFLDSTPIIDDGGTVFFLACVDPGDRCENSAIFSGDGGQLAVLFDTAGALASILEVSVNNSGLVAFAGLLDSGMGGLFTGYGDSFDPIILRGDPLFGSTLVSVELSRHGLSDSAEVAFYYELADGRLGVARAGLVPEPGSLALIATGLAFVALARAKMLVHGNYTV